MRILLFAVCVCSSKAFYDMCLVSDCETKYKGYCIGYSGTCHHGNILSYSDCGTYSFCCHPNHAAILTGSPTLSEPPTPSTVNNNSVTSQCGGSGTKEPHRIVGGGRAEPHEYPWQVSLRYGGHHMCGGTLVHAQWVLTAAHCFKQTYLDYWTVAVGLHDIINVHQSHVIPVSGIFTHSLYSEQSNANDIALVKLAKQLDIEGTDTRTACLPGSTEEFEGICTVTGWGAHRSKGHIERFLQEANVPIISNEQCAYYMGTNIHNSNICAGYRSGGKDACQGDSGGPLVCHNEGAWHLAGIVSWGRGCGEMYSPGVYTRVSAFVDWIENVISRHS